MLLLKMIDLVFKILVMFIIFFLIVRIFGVLIILVIFLNINLELGFLFRRKMKIFLI